ncbi:NADH-quinone oxidoreductase subunit G [Rhodococcus sp. IEGM 1305]|uniref:NADH-quinone oxidoreductase subunit G n=1 Tax=Rhodococcus sp. IEGM 1305 TaxID=3047092 RepID=UPI0024B6F44F|nr:NADH-quinone oxidoreductase subunit G [Rhodococcus sp. IEGM 1305]MDI9949815.1 NADH-quinone oxidoreductase subunit G [Rhodococcus sp. IEGM 1305]
MSDEGRARVKGSAPASVASHDTSPDAVSVVIDGVEVSVPKGTLVIRAAEMIGIQIPRFCDHPLLDPVGACRQCLVDVEGQRKPLASCTTTVTDGMVVHTQLTSPVADKAQKGVMELLLINHPLDCPVCDKGGECPLQNQAMSNGRAESRFGEVKRTFPKPIPLSTEVLLDRERCVLCARCTRFSQQVAGDPFIELMERGALQQVGIYAKEPFESYFSGNTVQICPVGALTGSAYRFRARPFDLVSSPSVCEHCASGCAQRTDHRRGKVLRRLAGDDPEVNEEWNCDKGRWAFAYATERDRITAPLVRGDDGTLAPASWSEALAVAARGLAAARGNAGVLVGGRSTWEDAYAYAKFARTALGTNDIDFRSRAHSGEEAEFLAARVAGQRLAVTYDDLDAAPVVLLAAFEPEEESPIVFLRLRKAARAKAVPVYSIAPYTSRGLEKTSGRLLRSAPNAEAEVLDGLRTGDLDSGVTELLRRPGAVIVVGERLAGVPGALSAAVRLADETGARLAWVPRRAGERGALEAGALPGLLPGGRPVDDPEARRQVASVWNVADLPETAGRDTAGILAAAEAKTLGALLIGGVEADDLPDPQAALAAVEAAGFVVSLELRHSAISERADVVFPIAPVMEKPGTFLDWEGRARDFDAALRATGSMPDQRVLHAIAGEMGVPLGLPDAATARRELERLGAWDGDFPDPPGHPHPPRREPGPGEAVLATWRMLLDSGRLQDGEPHLAGTARTPVVRVSAASAAESGAGDGDPVTVTTERGAVTLPLVITDMPDRVVWLPLNSPGSAVYPQLAARAGDVVNVRRAAGTNGMVPGGPL